MTEPRGGLVLCWYFHLPTLCADGEVDDLARRSIAPLLRVHRQTKTPVTLAVTGTLLARLATRAPKVVDDLQDLHARQLCEVAATCLHEIYPPDVPLEYLSRHVVQDIALKKRLLGLTPSTFYPPNLVWVGAFGQILAEAAVDRAILDGMHYRLAASAQTWRWSQTEIDHVATELLPADVDPSETQRVVACQLGSGTETGTPPRLRCFFRENRTVSAFSFGNSGLLHRDDLAALGELACTIKKQTVEGRLITLADDGDRVNPVSLYGYESFLDRLGEAVCTLPSACEANPGEPDLPYLPSFAIDGFRDFLHEGVDSEHYLSLLNELYRHRMTDPAKEAELMALQDVFFLFWKTVPRKRDYLERVLKLHALARELDAES